MKIPKPNKRPPMPMVIPSKAKGKTYYQLRVLLEEYKSGIWTAEEVAEIIFKLFRRKQNED